MSLTVVSAFGPVGLTSTATRLAAGTSSRKISSRLAVISPLNRLSPVRLPPGRARLATRPSLTGSSPTRKTIGIAVVAALAAIAPVPKVTITRTCLCTNSAANDLLQPTEKSGHVGRIGSGRRGAEKPDQRHCWLLRARHERPRRRCAEQRDKCAAFHPPPRWERATRITVAHHSAAGARCAAKYPVGLGLQWVKRA